MKHIGTLFNHFVFYKMHFSIDKWHSILLFFIINNSEDMKHIGTLFNHFVFYKMHFSIDKWHSILLFFIINNFIQFNNCENQ